MGNRLAPSTVLQRSVGWSCEHRVRCVALQWNPPRGARTRSFDEGTNFVRLFGLSPHLSFVSRGQACQPALQLLKTMLTHPSESLYINPILSVLARQNPPNSTFLTTKTHNGVFDTSGGQTLYLFVDLKTDGASTWPAVIKALEPLRKAGYLSSVNGTVFTSGAVTVIGTGNTPLNLVQPIASRDYFWDAPVPTLNSTFSNITSLVSPIASADFAAVFGPVLGTSLNSTQLGLLRAQVATAHAKGIKLRYWDQPGWPLSTRNGIWRQLTTEGVDLINADDVEAAAGFGDEW